jgi:hypothetical protein
VSIKDCVVLTLVSTFGIILTVCRVFMGPDKPSSLVTAMGANR